MTLLQLKAELAKHKIREIRFIGRPFVSIKKEDFERYEEYFQISRNWLNTKINYRSKHWFRHIHAIDNGIEVQFHVDNGNISRNFLFAIPHSVFDVAPFFLGCLFHWKKPFNIDI